MTCRTFDGVASGSFTAPDHEYPAYLAQADCHRLRRSNRHKEPAIGPEDGQSDLPDHSGWAIADSGGSTSTSAFTRTVIVGSTNTISAVSPQTEGSRNTYGFSSWSDGGAQTPRHHRSGYGDHLHRQYSAKPEQGPRSAHMSARAGWLASRSGEDGGLCQHQPWWAGFTLKARVGLRSY